MPQVAPGGTIGILGGGQLGRMLASAAAKLGLKTHIFAPETNAPAAHAAAAHTAAPFDDTAALETFARTVDVVTLEFENVPVAALEVLIAAGAHVAPGPRALAVAQDRLVEKTFMNANGAATAPFAPVDDLASLGVALEEIGAPAILKTRRFGYDGKGQTVIRSPSSETLSDTWEQAKAHAWKEIGARPSILEGFIPFACEISVVAARGWDGAVAMFDPARNEHENGILRRSTVPSGVSDETIARAHEIVARVLQALDYVGVLGVEFFVLKDGGLMVNEFAPRVHNSGHWTHEACHASQFEQHIRAVCGWPLGNPARHSDAVMENLLGADAHRWREIAADAGASLTLYGKGEARTGRKMGHVTRISPLTESRR